MNVALVYGPALAAYRFPDDHPLSPDRFSLAVDLIRAWGLLEDDGDAEAERPRPLHAIQVAPKTATTEDLLLVHDADYIEHIRAVSWDPLLADPKFGIGFGDTPAFPGLDEAARLIAGASRDALELVLSGSALRAFSPAGGLHHAMRDYASGFCVYNDCAIAIERAIRSHPGVRIAYVDIDAHHGDGVEAAFVERQDVLTISVHESGRYLFPHTGYASDIGEGAGRGFALNVPLPPYAGAVEYAAVMDEVVVPALRAYAPDVIFAQLGADTHRNDPLTQLDQTILGFCDCVRVLVEAADEVCGGRIVAVGGGGYGSVNAVPRMWASVYALLLGVPVPAELPAVWRERAVDVTGHDDLDFTATFQEVSPSGLSEAQREDVRLQTRRAIDAVTAASPLLGAGA